MEPAVLNFLLFLVALVLGTAFVLVTVVVAVTLLYILYLTIMGRNLFTDTKNLFTYIRVRFNV